MGSSMGRPQFRSFLELPISVKHAYEGYPEVDAALISLEQGNFYDASLLSDACYTDDRVLTCLTTRINGLFSRPLEFAYPGQKKARSTLKPTGPGQAGATTKPKDSPEVLALKQQITQLVAENWERMMPGAVGREQMRWALMVNAGLGELIWDWGADGLLWPTLRTWNSQFIYWRWDTRSLWLIHADGEAEVKPGDGRWVLFSPAGHNHGWLYGLIRALGKLWLDRVFAQRDSARASEKYSLGVLLGKVPSNAAEPDKSRFEQTVVNMPNESFIMLPQGSKKDDIPFGLDMLQTDQMTHPDFFDKRLHRLDTNIAVCLLGQNLTTDMSTGSSGSRAAAQVHDNVRGDYTKADEEIWSSMVRTQVLRPFVDYNFGDIIRGMGRRIEEFVPEVSHDVEPAEDMQKKATAVAAVVGSIPNLEGTHADVNALLSKFDVPLMDVEESPEAEPGADVNERPPPPPGDADGADEPQPTEALEMSRRRSLGKPGQRKGRVVADELIDAAKGAAAQALAARRKALLNICLTGKSVDDIRERIRELYLHAKPTELRGIVEKAIATAHLLGRVSARVDHRDA